MPRLTTSIGLLLLLAIFGAAVVFLVPHINSWWELQYGFDRYFEIFSNRLNWPHSWSVVLARIMQIVTALAWAPLGWLTFGLLPMKATPQRWAGIIGCWLIVYAAPAALVGAFGSNVCFSKDGSTDKWYVQSADGHIVLFDSGGYDSFGKEKKRANAEICERFALQTNGQQPARIAYSSGLSFFSGSGASLLWYHRASNGTIELYDKGGYHPVFGAKLLPVTRDIVEELQRQDVARRRAEAEQTKLAADKAEQDALRAAFARVEAAGGTSFDCVRARSAIEILICSEESLAAMDRRLGEAFGMAAGALPTAERREFLSSQQRWVSRRNAECAPREPLKSGSADSDRVKACLAQSIAERIAAIAPRDPSKAIVSSPPAEGGATALVPVDLSPSLKLVPR